MPYPEIVAAKMMLQETKAKQFWAFARRGWFVSIVLALILLVLPFRTIIATLIKAPQLLDQLASTSPFWQAIIKNGVTTNISTRLDNLLPILALVGGSVLFLYSVISGYRKTYQALDINSNYMNVVERHNSTDVALGSIAVRSLLINVPVVYWALFWFILLPRLVKLPIASLANGMGALVGACVGMVLIAIIVTHIGMVVTRLSLRFILREG